MRILLFFGKDKESVANKLASSVTSLLRSDIYVVLFMVFAFLVGSCIPDFIVILSFIYLVFWLGRGDWWLEN